MNRVISSVFTASALIFGVFLPREEAVAQTTQELVGTWTLVSIQLEKDGKRTDMYGPNPQGQQILDANGRYSLIITRSDIPKFASNNREAGTPEENKAAVQGSIAFFGTYTVDESAKTLIQHVESGSFPNFNGTDRKLSFSISGDELHFTTITAASAGGTAHLVWKRAKEETVAPTAKDLMGT
ncbi:MAG: lipocalin-like domain-containing protein [Verrucomicrobia bacterium]|nr:lipocalin-like domain-containing protein [Verrucomicrobiota bacterium]